MKTMDQLTVSEQNLPAYSVDWRFFLPITAESRVLIVSDQGADALSFFNKIGIRVTVCHYDDFSSLTKELQSESGYDVLVIPNSNDMISAQAEGFFQNYKSLLAENGTLLIGFTNRFSATQTGEDHKFRSTMRLMQKKLAGHARKTVFGCFPDLTIPEYVFPLDTTSVEFVLRHRYRYRLPKLLLDVLLAPFFIPVIVHLLPAYYILVSSEK